MDSAKSFAKEKGDDIVHMTRLLGDTRASEWQRALRKLLTVYYQHEGVKQAVTFISDNIQAAIQALDDPDLFPGFPCLYINSDRKPVVFDVDLWKSILIALNFELTEPEGNRHIDLIEVKVPESVAVPSLLGFHILLQNILQLTWDNLRLLLSLEDHEAYQFLLTLQDLLRTPSHSTNQALVKSLHEKQSEAMESLGFHKHRGDGKSSRSGIVWESPSSEQVNHLEVVLFGLFHHGRGLETYI